MFYKPTTNRTATESVCVYWTTHVILNCHAEGTVFPLLRNDPGGRILFLLISKGGRNFLEYQVRSKFYFMHCHVNVSKKVQKTIIVIFFFWFCCSKWYNLPGSSVTYEKRQENSVRSGHQSYYGLC